MSEKETKSKVLQELSESFYFYSEVKGKHFSGKQLALDYVIKPKDITGWKNKHVAFGVEFKDLSTLDKKGDTTNFTRWIAQCVDYSHTNWEGYGYLFILTCPGISTSTFINAAYKDGITARIVGQLGIGELKYSNYYGWTIYLHEQHRLWSQKGGVATAGKSWTLERKFGCR